MKKNATKKNLFEDDPRVREQVLEEEVLEELYGIDQKD